MSGLGLPSFTAGGGLTGGQGGNAGPATTTGINTITPAFDASNWTVATGGSQASPTNASGSAGGLANIPWMYIAGAALLGMLLWKRL